MSFNERYTDVGNGNYFARVFGNTVRYVRERGVWYINQGTHWAEDGDGELVRLAKAAISGIFKDAANDPDRPRELRDALLKHAMRSEGAPRIAAALSMLQSEAGITIAQAALDVDPFLFGVRNGVVDLRTGDFRQPRGDEYITRRSECDYSPHATSPLWHACLMRWMEDDVALVEYLQRATGYSLTGDTREQCLFIPYGPGANGKSKFIGTLRALLGGYGAGARIESFVDRRNDAASNDLAALAGVRFVCASEPKQGAHLAEGLVKELTGGEAIRARFLFREYFEFTPAFKLWLSTNHKPTIRGTDHAIWRRIRLIPFRVTIPDVEQDKTIGEALLRELPGILNWAITGCLMWQRYGLEAPSAVVEATAEYRREQDRVGQWIDERCVLLANARTQSTALYRDYCAWTKDRSEYPLSLTKFGTTLGERGFEKDQGEFVVYRGIGLRAQEAGNVVPMHGAARANS